MLESFNRVLVLAPHTDDGEFGCGGTIARLVEKGKEVFYVAFSSAEESVPEGYDKDVLKREMFQATRTLGIKPENVTLFSYPVRHFPKHRQEILEDMVKLSGRIKPDLVLMPSRNDCHQDHLTISEEGFRAFKKTTIFAYEIPWNNLTFTTSAFVELEEKHVDKKWHALSCYESQVGRSYATKEFVQSLAITRGTQIAMPYAEVFELLRLVIKKQAIDYE